MRMNCRGIRRICKQFRSVDEAQGLLAPVSNNARHLKKFVSSAKRYTTSFPSTLVVLVASLAR